MIRKIRRARAKHFVKRAIRRGELPTKGMRLARALALMTGATMEYPTPVLKGAQASALTALTITSGTPFVPNAEFDSLVTLIPNVVAGSYTVTMGPVLGTENAFSGTMAVVVTSPSTPFSFIVPAGWLVIVTLTTTTLAKAWAVQI